MALDAYAAAVHILPTLVKVVSGLDHFAQPAEKRFQDRPMPCVLQVCLCPALDSLRHSGPVVRIDQDLIQRREETCRLPRNDVLAAGCLECGVKALADRFHRVGIEWFDLGKALDEDFQW